MCSAYVHGYDVRKNVRLRDQVSILQPSGNPFAV